MKNNLQKIRWEKNLSQKTLSQKSGVSQSVISSVENGLTTPNLSTALRLAKALGVSVEEIFSL